MMNDNAERPSAFRPPAASPPPGETGTPLFGKQKKSETGGKADYFLPAFQSQR